MEIITHVQDWKYYKSYYLMESKGLAMVRITRDVSEFEISDLYVNENYREQGMGTAILNAAINLCKELSPHNKIFITTNKDSSPFVDEWYMKLGFKFHHLESPINLLHDKDLEWNNVYIMEF